MPYHDERRIIAPKRTAEAYKAANAHSFLQIRPFERLVGFAEGSYSDGKWKRYGTSEGAELVITSSRLLVLDRLPRDRLVPAKLLDEGDLEAAGRIFLPTTAAEREEPWVLMYRIAVNHGTFNPGIGWWFHHDMDASQPYSRKL